MCELADDQRGGIYVETLVVSAACWWGLWRVAKRLSRRF
jgi:hypothetical protein